MGAFGISRVNFDAKKHYHSVRMQQGRVITDDDWNENNRIHEEELRRSRVDFIGPFGSPDSGFTIKRPRVEEDQINFDIRAGSLYVGGLRLELEQAEPYRAQKDWLQQPADLNNTPTFDGEGRCDLVYINAWQQPVSAVEDSSLLDVALAGPATTTRLKTMRRVCIAADLGFDGGAEAWQQLISNWERDHLGKINEEQERITDVRLKVTFGNSGMSENPGTPTVAGGYLGAENQTIRVQLVDPNSFVWGFDNASPLYRVTISADGKEISLLPEPKDQNHVPLSNQIVEILPCSAVLPNGEKIAELSGHLSKVGVSYNPDICKLTLTDPLPDSFKIDCKRRSAENKLDNQATSEYYYMRVWNRGNDLSSDAKISFTPGTPVALGHTGLEITITGSDIVAPDYWVITIRPGTPNRVVPWELEQGLGIAPHGIRRFFAPLAVIRWSKVNDQISGEVTHDFRRKFNPLTGQNCSSKYGKGEGVRSMGDSNSNVESLAKLPPYRRKKYVMSEEHTTHTSILNRKQIQMNYTTLNEVTETIIAIIQRAVDGTGLWPTLKVQAELLKNNNEGIGFYLYHVQESNQNKNFSPPGRNVPQGKYAPMALNLFYILSPNKKKANEEDLEDALDEQLLMSVAMKALHDNPVITRTIRSQKNINIKITQQSLSPRESVEYWAAAESAIRLSSYYEVSVVYIE